MTVCTCGRDLERRLVGGLVVYRHVAGWQVLDPHRIEPRVDASKSAQETAPPAAPPAIAGSLGPSPARRLALSAPD